jgi:hypothetical protein
MRNPRTVNNRGVALVSVIAGVAILTIALTMATSAFYTASRVTTHTANLAVASSFAEGALERTVSQPFDMIRSGPVADDLPKLSEPTCFVRVVPDGSGLKEVTVTFSWTEHDRAREVQLSTLAAKGGDRP